MTAAEIMGHSKSNHCDGLNPADPDYHVCNSSAIVVSQTDVIACNTCRYSSVCLQQEQGTENGFCGSYEPGSGEAEC